MSVEREEKKLTKHEDQALKKREERAMEAFWDEFAPDYAAIQDESRVPIVPAIEKLLLAEHFLPARKILDLAAGTGKYLPALAPHAQKLTLVDISTAMLNGARAKKTNADVTFIHASQADFFQQTAPNTFDLAFSAMNPALVSEEDLHAFAQMAPKRMIVRLLTSTDTLFSPYEKEASDPWLNVYEEILRRWQWPYQKIPLDFTTS